MNKTQSYFLIIGILLVSFLSYYVYKRTTGPSSKCPQTPVTAGMHAQYPAGCFDYYAFNQIWIPEDCHSFSRDGCSDLASTFDNKLRPHGLWPGLDSTTPERVAFPALCTEEKFDPESFSKKATKQLHELYPLPLKNLPKHEWEKHGTCRNIPQEDYFQEVSQYNKRIVKLSSFIQDNVGSSVSYKKLADAYSPALKNSVQKSQIVLYCQQYKGDDKQYFSSMTTYWTKKRKPLKRVVNSEDKTKCKDHKPIHIRSAESLSSDEKNGERIHVFTVERVAMNISSTNQEKSKQ